MALISFNHDELKVALTAREKLAGLHGDVRVPLSAVREVRVTADAVAAPRGLRAPGLALPGRIKIGTWRGRRRRQFVVARRGVPAVHLVLAGAAFDELIVSTPEADRIAGELRARLEGAGAGPALAHAQRG